MTRAPDAGLDRGSPESIAERAERLRAGAGELRRLGADRRCAALAAAAARIGDASAPTGRRARDRLPSTTGLSQPMVDWALRASLSPLTEPALRAIAEGARAPSGDAHPKAPQLVAVVLAGNVFTAAIRPIAFSLLVGSPVACKASSRGDDLFPALLAAALMEVDPAVGRSLYVTSFPGGDEAMEQALFSRSDLVIGYGGDETMKALRARLPVTIRLVEHGHGVSAAYFGGAALASRPQAVEAAHRFALDVAAYDQRGCLSPQVLWVQRGHAVGREEVAALVHEALARMEEILPRGMVPPDAGAAQMQWRGVMGVRGRLHAGKTHAVASPADDELRLGPGHRNVLVLDCEDVADVARRLAPFGHHLKAVGTACDEPEQRRLVDLLEVPLTPRLCPVGRMQTPPLDGFTEGLPPLDGLLRWVQAEPAGPLARAP